MRKQLQAALDALLREDLAPEPGAFDELVGSLDTGPLHESAMRFGTPQYLLNVNELRSRASSFLATMKRHIRSCEAYYALKCNDLPLLVDVVRSEGYGADVASLFELKLALRLGFERIVFSGPGKSADELGLALRHRKRVIVNVDNLDELLAIREMVASRIIRRPLRLGFRISPEVAPSSGQPWSKFGLSFDELPEAIETADAAAGLAWVGLQIHTSWNKTPERYVQSVRRIGRFLSTSLPAERVRGLRFVDLGGGFYPEGQATLLKSEDRAVVQDLLAARLAPGAVPHPEPSAFRVTKVAPLDSFARSIAEAVREELTPVQPDLSVYLEPGRFLATHPTTILLRVVAVKGDRVIVDGGINMLGDYKFSEYAFAPIVNATRPSTRVCRRVIYGPLCDPHDLWGFAHYGETLRKGDLVAVLHQGAYTFATAWRFIRAVPPYAAFEGGRLALAKRAERFADRFAGCAFPR